MSERKSPPAFVPKESLKRPAKLAFLVGFLVAVYSLFLPNYYRSEARLLPLENGSTGRLGNLAAAAVALGVGVGSSGGDANFVDVLNSRWLGERLLESEFNFHTRFWYFGREVPHKETLRQYLRARNSERAIQGVRGMLNANKDLKTNVITLLAETESPELSQQLVRKALELLNQFEVQHNRTRGSEKAAFAEARLADARRAMEELEQTYGNFLRSNRNFQTSSDPGVRLRGMQLEAEFTMKRQLIATLALNREQALLDAKNDIPIINVLDPGHLPTEKSKPPRSVLVLASALLAGALTWTRLNWAQVRVWLLSSVAGEDISGGPSAEAL